LNFSKFVAVCLAASLVAGHCSAGEKNGKGEGKRMLEGRHPLFDMIKEHEADLNVTPEQKKQLKTLEDEVDKKREAMRKDPDTRELFKEVMEARKAGDEAKLKELREKVRGMMDSKNAGDKGVMDQLAKILQPQQLAKLKQLHEAEGGRMGGKLAGGPGRDKPEDHKAPDTNKGAPKLYDDEKKDEKK
jgi:Spy/CpxP family protein refolding chaperone